MGLFTSSVVERFGTDLLDRISLGISIYRIEKPGDPASFRLVYSNAASETITGLDADAEVGRMLIDVVPSIGETGLLEAYLDILADGEARDLGAVTYADGRLAPATYAVQAVPLAADTLAVVFQDVSDTAEVQALRKAQEELGREEARYRSLVEATAAIVWTTNPAGELELDPQQWHEVTGQTPEAAAGQGWTEAIHPDDLPATETAWTHAVATGTPYQVEHRLLHADGSYRRMAARGTPIRDDDGAIVEWVGIHTDIEEQSQAAAALAASEARFRSLFDALDDVVLVYPIGPEGAEPLVAFNQAAVSTYGWTAEELTTKTITDLIAPGRVDVDGALAELRRTRRATFESTHITRDGTRLPMATAARLVEYDGRLCVVSLCRDDTDRRQFRRTLARSNRELEAAVAERTTRLEAFGEDLKILHGITTAEHASPEARFEAYLRAGCEMFDLPIGILSATPLDPATGERLYRLQAVVSPDPSLTPGLTVPITEAFCDAVVETGATVAYADAIEEAPEHPACVSRGLRAFIGTPVLVAGETVGTLNFVSPEPRPGGFSASERDLVEVMAQAVGRRIEADRAEEARSEARERYRAIVETVDAGVIVVDADLRVVMSNPSARALLGLDPDTGEADPLEDRWPVVDEAEQPMDSGDLPERRALESGEVVRGVIQGIAAPGQPVRWYRVNASPLDDDQDGVPDAVVVSFHDVTDLREAARGAELAQRRLVSVLDATSDGIYGLDLDGRTTFVNQAAVHLTGWSAEEQVGSHQHDLIHHRHADGTDFPAETCPIYQTLQDGEPRAHDDQVFWRKDGTALPVAYTVLPIREKGEVRGAVVQFRERA